MTDHNRNLTPEELDRLAELESKATPGVWRAPARGLNIAVHSDTCLIYSHRPIGDEVQETRERWDADAKVIAALRNAFPALLAMARRAEKFEHASDKQAVAWKERTLKVEAERDAIRILALDAMNERDGYKDLAREDMVQVLATIQGALTRTINERDEARRRVGGPADEGTLRDCSDCGRPLVWKHSGGEYPGSMVCPRCVVDANDTLRARVEELERDHQRIEGEQFDMWVEKYDALRVRHANLVEAVREEHEDCQQAANHRANPRLSGPCAMCALLADEGTKG